MTKILEKVERRLGEKLLLKGERCAGPKCAMVRRSYPPGSHGKARRKRISEYGELLREKQKVRFVYGLDDKDIKRYSKEAASRPGVFGSNFWRLLETRLDNIVFRIGFTISRRASRALVGHGHILVNGRSVKASSYRVKLGDVVSIKERSLKTPLFTELDLRLKNYEAPKWLSIDKEKKEGRVVRIPDADEFDVTFDVIKIKEFYSR